VRVQSRHGGPAHIDAVVHQIRTELAACIKMADERGEPPLDQQD
jgi:hypothetical protein